MDKNKINKILGGALLLLLAGFLGVLLLQLASLLYTPSREACSMKVCLKKFLDGPPAFNDEYMASFLRNKFITPASSGPLALANTVVDNKDTSFTSTQEYLREYFKDRRDGRFLVLGAGDGEYQDLSLALEKELGWTGMLVEPNPHLHKILLSKQRNAEICSTCISPYSYPTLAELSFPAFEGIATEHEKMIRYRETKLKQLWEGNFKLETFQLQCVPLVNIIYASTTITNKIDLLVLDMAGSDLDLLLSTDLDWLPETEMIVVVSHGVDVASEIGGYFMEKNMVVSKVFGDDAKYARFIITKFQSDISLVD